MYRLRTADKGKPLIISDKVIHDYSDGDVDTLHKKNLLSLGEDRYLTTLMTKHFPSMSYKFIPDAHAFTAAPESFSVLLSQRRRWINSTVHNLAELFWLKDMCGFCCFSMRFVVFIDLFGTIILPSVCAYLGYLIYMAASHTGQFPIVSIIMLAAVYGLQAIIFIIKRQWQHVGWMIIYIIAFPIYSFLLPMYSFWKQDDFSWGNTRVVVGEKGDKKAVLVNDDGGFDPRSIPLQRWDDYAAANNLPGRRGYVTEKSGPGSYEDGPGYEMDDMQSVYSSVKPASTILTGFPNQGHIPPQPMAPPYAHRQSTYSNMSGNGGQHERLMSMGGMSDGGAGPAANNPYNNPYGQRGSTYAGPQYRQSTSSENLMATGSAGGSMPNLLSAGAAAPRVRSPLGYTQSRPVSQVNFMDGPKTGPTDQDIVMAVRECLQEVNLDDVTKKQLKALAEQRLQTQLQGERKQFLDQMIDVELAKM
jgi:chitin synthase